MIFAKNHFFDIFGTFWSKISKLSPNSKIRKKKKKKKTFLEKCLNMIFK